jgi:hypothetical protein
MAGRTFPGIGELEDGEPVDPADEADTGATPASSSSQFYSGPTVVDDAKVEEGLEKLRSLDVPPDDVAAAVDTALEIVESGGHQMPSYLHPAALKDGGRGTFIGHSIADVAPPSEPEKPYDDRMRGTLYGHMLHLPELKLPAPEEPSSRELTIVDRSGPTSHAVEVYQPDAARRAAAGVPHEAEAFPRSDRYRSIPIEIETGSSSKVFVRVGIAAAAIAAIVGAAIIWLHTSTEEPEPPVRPPATAPQPAAPAAPRAAPLAEPAQVPAATAAGSGPATPVPQAAPAEPVAAKPPRELRPPIERPRNPASRPEATPPSAGLARPDRHRSGGPASGDGPPRTRSSRHPAIEDDPDGTLAPSIE